MQFAVSEHLWNENYVTNIIVHIHYMRRSKIMKRIYSVHRQARPSKVVVSFCFLNSPAPPLLLPIVTNGMIYVQSVGEQH